MGPAVDEVREHARQVQALQVPIEGDLDFETAPEVRDRVMRLLAQGHTRLVLDLSRCGYIDSSGMLALVAVGEHATSLGGSVVLQGASTALLNMLRLSRMGQALGLPESAAPPTLRHRRFPDTGVGKWDMVRIVALAVPQSCADVRHAVMGEAATTPLTAEDRADVELAVGEAFANAVRHGSPQGARGRVTVRVLKGDDAFVVEVSDHGQGFDRSQLPAPEPEEIREGGLGIFYMEALMDAVEFDAGPHGTTVRLLKRYPQTCAGVAPPSET